MLPKGYHVYREFTDCIEVAVTDSLLMFEDAPETIEFKTRTYERGTLEVIPMPLATYACSLRTYNLKESCHE